MFQEIPRLIAELRQQSPRRPTRWRSACAGYPHGHGSGVLFVIECSAAPPDLERNGKSNGEEDYEVASVDEGRCPYIEDAGARRGKNNCDRAEAQAECRSDASEGNETWCDIGNSSTEENNITNLPTGYCTGTAMAKAKKRVAARKASSKRGKASASPSRKKVAKRVTPKKVKSKVRRATKPAAKKKRPAKTAVRKAPRQGAEVPVETTIIDVIEELVPGVLVVTEYESVRRAPPTSTDAKTELGEGTGPGKEKQ